MENFGCHYNGRKDFGLEYSADRTLDGYFQYGDMYSESKFFLELVSIKNGVQADQAKRLRTILFMSNFVHMYLCSAYFFY